MISVVVFIISCVLAVIGTVVVLFLAANIFGILSELAMGALCITLMAIDYVFKGIKWLCDKITGR